MRFAIYSVFLSLWMGMWVWTYTCHIKAACCPVVNGDSATDVIPRQDDNPLISFRWSDDEPILDAGFVFYRDSIIALLHEDQMLQITGRYHTDEKSRTDNENLGMARAGSVLAIFAPQLDSSRFLLRSVRIDDQRDPGEMAFNAIDIKRVKLKFTKSQ